MIFYIYISCILDLSRFISYYETYFYELFLLDIDGTYVPIPVLINSIISSTG